MGRGRDGCPGNGCSAVGDKYTGGFTQGSACGDNIIDEKDPLSPEEARVGTAVDTQYIGLSRGGIAQTGLHLIIADLL